MLSAKKAMKRCNRCSKLFGVSASAFMSCSPCTKCGKTFDKRRGHVCKSRKCNQCGKFILRRYFDGHTCKRRMCSVCARRFPRENFDEHVCNRTKRSKCKITLTIEELLDHTCGRHFCRTCAYYILTEDWETHECGLRTCQRCHERFPADGTHACKFYRCPGCEKVLRREDVEDHLPICPRHEKHAQGLCTSTSSCKNPIAKNYLICEEHRRKFNGTKTRIFGPC